MLTFRVEGGFEKASAIIQNLKLASHFANLGMRLYFHAV
jgi:O-acetylhomoserine/O-acetylserine sulfhydrylase-like pyridoxal-dependent enzyme